MLNKTRRVIIFQIVLFILTLITTTLAGAEWIYGRYFFLNEKGFGWNDWIDTEKIIYSLNFSVPFLLILTVHEFGHYFTAQWYKVKVTLPYYIPLWFGLGSSIGTMGAFIKIKEQLKSRKQYFDIGIAGPLSGFVVALIVLAYGYTHLPPAEYIFSIHPEYQKYGLEYAQYVYTNVEGRFYLGKNLLFWLIETYLAPNKALIPNAYEMMHYPFLFAGYLACFFTALNLMPIGQLDGGHILYGLVGGRYHAVVSVILFIIFVFYAGLGIVTPAGLVNIFDTKTVLYLIFLYFMFSKIGGTFARTFILAFGVMTAQLATTYFFPQAIGYNGWLLFAMLLGRFLGVFHPPVEDNSPLDSKRKLLGWISLIIFILCFTPAPFVFE
ncbi:MAG: site-2 protease family protein [Cytophagales bacterium]|nr:site-2 protease family protein [Cytophagales bacterium]